MRVDAVVVTALLVTAGVALAQSPRENAPWAPLTTTPGAPLVEFAEPRHDPGGTRNLESTAAPGVELVSPWSTGTAAEGLAAAAPTIGVGTARTEIAGSWAQPPTEVIDPWASALPVADWVPPPDLIVDPWALDE